MGTKHTFSDVPILDASACKKLRPLDKYNVDCNLRRLQDPFGGLLTSRIQSYSTPFQICQSNRVCILEDQTVQKRTDFSGFPGWVIPILYSEYQVPLPSETILKSLTSHHVSVQAGYSEDWLRSIYSNLTDELSFALRDAWLATVVIQRVNSLRAENNLPNRTQMAFAAALGLSRTDGMVLSFTPDPTPISI